MTIALDLLEYLLSRLASTGQGVVVIAVVAKLHLTL
jgi:hypothetical protein